VAAGTSIQKTCMSYSASPQQVVYEEDPASVAKLLADPVGGYARGFWDRQNVGYKPPCFRRTVFDMFPFDTAESVPYLHERRSPSGHQRVVAVGFKGKFDHWVRPMNSAAWIPCAVSGLPTVASHNEIISLFSNLKQGDSLRLYAGQSDTRDLSHFTIGYEVNDQSGTIDGWLLNDETVWLQVRDGPALPAIPVRPN
jgi:hypothetical protein